MKSIVRWLETRFFRPKGSAAAEEEWLRNLMPDIYGEEEVAAMPNLSIIDPPSPDSDKSTRSGL